MRPRLTLSFPSHVFVAFVVALTGAPVAAQHVLVSSDFGDAVPMFDLDGNFVRNFVPPGGGGLDSPQGITVGPDGNVYVSSAANDKVLRYNGQTGEFMGAFVDGGRLNQPWYLRFGPDGNLYVSSSLTAQVLCYDGQSGAFIRAAAQGGALFRPDGTSFDDDGTLLVSEFFGSPGRLKRYNPQTGAFIEDVVIDNGLTSPLEHRLSADGETIFVSSFGTNSIRKYDKDTGAYLGDFASGPLRGPVGQLPLPDGSLLVSSWNNSTIYRFDLESGELIGTFTAGGGGLNRPNNMTLLVPEPSSMLVAIGLAVAALRRRRAEPRTEST
jgi:DNA-binding beta-propeller fold protein YncE